MQNLKNIVVGFIVSFVGSIPLGYLNVVGFDIYTNKGLEKTLFYLLGVVFIESFVIFFTLIFAKKLTANRKLTKIIEFFSILFMFVLAAVFYFTASTTSNDTTVFSNVSQNFFFAGLLFSSFNFMQIPFWTGWNLWLLNGKYIEIAQTKKYFYLAGTVAGTFCGMLVLILSLHYFTSNITFLSNYLMKYIIPIVFACLGIFQGIQFWRKY
jgi:hypothetical protein